MFVLKEKKTRAEKVRMREVAILVQ